jgi:predicted transcriptional regulator
MDFQKITIFKIRKPIKKDINEELQWIGSSLGLFNLRDKDKSCFRIFIELIKNTKNNEGITSDELAYRLNLSRGTVIHHIKKLKNSGLVILEHNKYILRVNNLNSLVDEINKDIQRTYEDLKDVAKDIDRKLGL